MNASKKMLDNKIYMKLSNNLYNSFIKINNNSVISDQFIHNYIYDLNNILIFEFIKDNSFKSLFDYKNSESLIFELKNIKTIFNDIKYKYGNSILNSRSVEIQNKYFFDYLLSVVIPICLYLEKLRIDLNYKPVILGIQAHQGCGKTTLCDMISYYLSTYKNINAVTVSSDDYYLKYNDQILLTKKNNMFKYRGPPGTHEVNLLYDLIDKVKNKKSNYYLTKYDKSLNKGAGDRIENTSENYINKPIDILIFEGWFNGIKSVNRSVLQNNLINNYNKEIYNTESNKSLLDFQEVVSEYLKNDYESMWDNFDTMLILKPEKYEYSKFWRIEAERIKGGMNLTKINEFVEYFWNSIPPNIYFDNLLKNSYSFKSNNILNNINNNAYKIDNNVINCNKPFILNCDINRDFYIQKF